MTVDKFDAVNLGIMWDRLISITDEVTSALVRSSFSTIVRESGDLSVVLLDAAGNSLAQGSYSVPSFTGTAAPTLRHMLKRFPPETLRPGDVVATNDAWQGTGHLFDINVMRPIFKGDKIVGYTISITHLPDIGGAGFGAGAPEIYHEGLRLPICKLVREGALDETVIDVVRNNVRVPEQVFGDLMANVTCNEVGGRELLEFLDEYQLDDVEALSAQIRAASERTIREAIARIPDGAYASEVRLEAIDEPVTLVCEARIRGEEIAIDFAGTGGVVARGVNVPFCYTRAMALYAVKCLTVPTMPNNEGATGPIAVSAPVGSILNALPPAATGARHVIGHYVVPCVFGALAEAVPDMVQADCGLANLITFQGTHRDGRRISTIYFASGGFGALKGRDGAEVTPGPTNMGSVPAEMWESLTSTTIVEKRLLADSGGPGAARGGAGQEITFRNDSGSDMQLFCMAARTEFPARGLLGGGAGGRRLALINGEAVHPKGTHVFGPGDTFTIREAGGGGFGDPKARPKALVEADVASGLVTAEAAARDYGRG